MKYHKIRAKTIAGCMMRLRSAYGSNAIILATREIREGGLPLLSFFSKKLYEVDFMLPESASFQEARPTTGQQKKGRGLKKREDLLPKGWEGEKKRLPTERGEDRIGKLFSQATKNPTTRKPTTESPTTENLATGNLTTENLAAENRSPENLTTESLTVENLADEPLKRERRPANWPLSTAGAAKMPTATFLTTEQKKLHRNLVRIAEQLIAAQMSPAFSEHFLQELDNSLSNREKEQYPQVESRAIVQLAALIRSSPQIAPPPGECRAVMLMGPTGAGKTTSIAKMAARFQLAEKREISIYSLDHFRLAATEQLKIYAGVLEAEFHAPVSQEQFVEQLRRDGAELMLIDTSGAGYQEELRFEQLKNYVATCEKEVRLDRHLVLSANTNSAMLEKILLAYDQIGFDKIILTKTDESDFIGAFVEIADRFNRPFSFLMNGQNVPGDILEPDSTKMAQMILGVATGGFQQPFQQLFPADLAGKKLAPGRL